MRDGVELNGKGRKGRKEGRRVGERERMGGKEGGKKKKKKREKKKSLIIDPWELKMTRLD